MFQVKEVEEKFEVYYEDRYVGFVRKKDLQEPDKVAKVLDQVLVTILSWKSTSKSKPDTSLGEDLFHICTAGIFEK